MTLLSLSRVFTMLVLLVSLSTLGKAYTLVAGANTGKRVVLQGGVSLDDAMALEGRIQSGKQAIDWYGWYLSARESITERGGLQCKLGTLIRINKAGLFQASSPDPDCQKSVARQWFPLPQNSHIPVIILPVRSGAWQPMSEQELLRRVDQGIYKSPVTM